MPMYMDLPEILKKYEGFTITQDLMKKIIYECTPKHWDVEKYYEHD